MNRPSAESDKVKFQPDIEVEGNIAAMVVGFLGGAAVAEQTGQSQSIFGILEIFGTAGVAIAVVTGVAAGIQYYRHRRWLAGEDRLYTEEIDTEVAEHFEPGFGVLNAWRRRWEERKKGN